MDGCEIAYGVARLSIATNRDRLLSFAAPCLLESPVVLSGLGSTFRHFRRLPRCPKPEQAEAPTAQATIGGVSYLAKGYSRNSVCCEIAHSPGIHAMLEELPDYGLTQIQAKVYYHLLRLGKASSTEISEKVGVHRSEVHRVLRELAEKGIVTERKDARPMLFTAVRPQVALDLLLQEQEKKLKNRRENLPRLVSWLNSQANVSKMRPVILLVDDDETIRKALSNALQEEGFSVDTTQDGADAVERSLLRFYDLALVDVRLSDMDGIKLLRTLRERNPEIKQIVITGYPSLENAVQAINEGADAYLIKPFNPSDLVAKIRELGL